MNTQYLSHSPSIKRQPGFALIATISVMVLLVMIALAMLSLSTIELRQSRHNVYQQKARANARMALMMAIGQLQQYSGPDQRITAPANIFNDAGTTAIHPLWSGVWKSNELPDGSEKKIFTRDSSTGSWLDGRSSGVEFASGNALHWLVSGDDPDPTQPIVGDSVILQNAFTSIAGEEINPVKVPLMKIDDGSSGYGQFAWFTDDLSTKANVALDNRIRPETLSAINGLNEYFAPYGFGHFKEPVLDDIDENDLGKLISLSSIGIPSKDNRLTKKALRDYTSHSQSLLTDTLNGGLKQDLTAFCASGNDLTSWNGLEAPIASHPILDSSWHEKFGPKFGLLRSWYKLKDDVTESGGDSEIAVHPPRNKPYSLSAILTENASISKLAGNQTPVTDLKNYDTASVHPVIVLAENQMVPCLDGSSAPVLNSTRRLYMKFYPRVVLWNPYNVTIKSQGYYVQGMYSWRVKLKFTGAKPYPRDWDGTTDLNFDLGPGSRAANFKNPIYQPIFYIEPTEIGPGESIMFTPKREVEWTPASQPGDLVLSANGRLTPFTIKQNDFIHWPNNPISDRVKITDVNPTYRLNFDRWRTNNGRAGTVGKARTWHLFKASSARKSWGSVHADTSNLLQSFYLSEDCYLSSDAPIDELPSTPLNPETNTAMPNQGRFTHRWHYIGETQGANVEGLKLINNQGVSKVPYAPFRSSPMANFNVRANWNAPTAMNIYGRSAQGRHVYGYYMDSLYDQPMDSAAMTPFVGTHTNKPCYSPFGHSTTWAGADRYILFDIPKPSLGVLSIGMLQHLSFSPFSSHPSYSVGNSYADIRYRRDRTSPEVSIRDLELWKNRPLHSNREDVTEKVNYTFAIQGEDPSDKALFVYDLAFEINRSLWDRFYFSNVEYNQSFQELKTGKWTSPYYRVNSSNTDSQDCFKDKNEAYHHAAEYLTVPGGFNVNSTSVPAWKAFLASCAQKDQAYKDGSDQGQVFFSRTHPAVGEAFDPGRDDMYSAAAWDGYRTLDDDELEELAQAIVDQVQKRGPFISVADFVNRRLKDDDTGKSGALQSAIDSTDLNDSFVDTQDDYEDFYQKSLDEQIPFYQLSYPGWDFRNKSPIPFQGMKSMPKTRVQHCSSYLQQGDILQALGPRLRVRGDTFRIRTYGDARDSKGKIRARAWVEAIVQRSPDPVSKTWDGIEPESKSEPDPQKHWGRQFRILHFQWLHSEEI